MVRKGELERIGRGIYFDNYDEMYFFQLQNKVCIYSYQTALYIHVSIKKHNIHLKKEDYAIRMD